MQHSRSHCFKSTLTVRRPSDLRRRAVYTCEVRMLKADGSVENQLSVDYRLESSDRRDSDWVYGWAFGHWLWGLRGSFHTTSKFFHGVWHQDPQNSTNKQANATIPRRNSRFGLRNALEAHKAGPECQGSCWWAIKKWSNSVVAKPFYHGLTRFQSAIDCQLFFRVP